MTRYLKSFSVLILLTFTGLGVGTSTAFSENLNDLLVGEVQNFAPNKAPRELRDFSFMNAEGKEEKLSDYKGKVVLLNFWATWCAPCRKEMPGLDRLQGDMGGDDFVVLAVGQDLQGMKKVQNFFTKLELENLGAFNDKTVKSGRAAGVFGLPATLLVNQDGLEVGRLVGPAEWDSPEAKALIQHVISGS
ncbi:MAG: TlpA family protein disulfide reductase [Proteobacteria bacterium]|nr:TlpA family protein disulfide reductase [Pseudomonadota bacterium]